MNLRDTDTFPENATIRQEYTKCGKVDCDKKHGPYLYAYWKDKGKLKKKYVGKSLEHHNRRITTIEVNKICFQDLTPSSEMEKEEFIAKEGKRGNKLALDYIKKLDNKQVRLDWAYRKIKENLYSVRFFRMLRIAKHKGYQHETHEQLSEFIANEMQNKGLEITEGNIDSYLNSELM